MKMTKNLLAVHSKITALNKFYDKSFLAVAGNITGRFTCASLVGKTIRFDVSHLSRVRDNRWYALHFSSFILRSKKTTTNYSMTLSSAWSLFLDCSLFSTHTSIHSLFRHFFRVSIHILTIIWLWWKPKVFYAWTLSSRVNCVSALAFSVRSGQPLQ